jgi:hypothetical protein
MSLFSTGKTIAALDGSLSPVVLPLTDVDTNITSGTGWF